MTCKYVLFAHQQHSDLGKQIQPPLVIVGGLTEKIEKAMSVVSNARQKFEQLWRNTILAVQHE